MSATSVRDCDCYVTENYFVDKVLNRTLRVHLYYDGGEEPVKTQLETKYGLVEDSELSVEEYACLFQILDEERERRMKLEMDHKQRKAMVSERYRSNQIMSNNNGCKDTKCTCGSGENKERKQKVRFKANYDEDHDYDRWLADGCIAALRACAKKTSGNKKSEILSLSKGIELLPDRIYALPILTPRACKLLDEEFKEYAETYKDIKGRPNTMNRFGVLLDELPPDADDNNMSKNFSNVLLQSVIRPLAIGLFGKHDHHQDRESEAETEERRMIREMCETLDHHHVFTVDYRAHQDGYDKDLSLHFDNSEITMNILLTKEDEFDGGELSFEGPSFVSPLSHRHKKHKNYYYEHQLGWGILHMGCEMHRALPVDHGRRSNLIVWCRSATHRLQYGCPMCGDTDRLKQDVLRRYLSLDDKKPHGPINSALVGLIGIGWGIKGKVVNVLKTLVWIR